MEGGSLVWQRIARPPPAVVYILPTLMLQKGLPVEDFDMSRTPKPSTPDEQASGAPQAAA
jgi:hypothetical protein